ncbi:hypothetical protein [Methylomonas koyamae]|uniref:hypothetical protein n=1 Tax=Methylomonas koyamae TaxID=702114 RepID=UPI000BC34D4D|nr:hypothetical protein [Methylomonas koyamae]ATG91838.1 hypothetical protein MKLM6_3653 [Methylomonas koyamae]
MAELLFIATTIFVAYVVFVVLGGKKEVPETPKAEAPKPEAAKPAPLAEPVAPPAAAKTVEKPTKPAPAKPAAKTASKAAPAKTAATKPATNPDSLKNPKTGEVAKFPASYSFAKRWIKDALVEEGLLDKVYKNNELDEATNAKIQAALQQLRTLDKYQ